MCARRGAYIVYRSELDRPDRRLWAITFVVVHRFPKTRRLSSSLAVPELRSRAGCATRCGVCGAFPFLAGQTTTVTNMGIIYTSSPIFIILISSIFFNEKINLTKIIGLISCLIGVFAIIIKGDLNLLINLNFTIGDLWMLAAAIGWALYSIYLFYWKTKLEIFQRFTLIAFFGAISLLPFYIGEEIFFEKTIFGKEFLMWIIFALFSP